MQSITPQLYALLVFMIVGSVIAIETRNLLSAVISVSAVGFALSVAFLFLGAPDIAITQLVVEVLVLIILIRGTILIDNTAIETHRDTLAVVSSLIFFGLLLGFGAMIFAAGGFPEFGEPLMRVSKVYVQTGLPATYAANIVTSVILDFRAYDTIGEATVLFASILGALALLRRDGKVTRREVATA
jgi:multisubunit Na+/H+ antiporter MnhB subunit